MQTKTFTHIQKNTKRTVVIHNVPIKRVLEDGTELLSTPTALRLDELLNHALAAGSSRVELWFAEKPRTKKVA
jgi:hypothetical protein